jgi:hypothetical protein
MADGHGGYRRPANPAPVSGPGRYSKRTDGHPAQVMSAAPDQGYGDAKAQLDQQRVQPMAAQSPLPKAAQAAQQGVQLPAFNGASLADPTQRPGEPVTAGVDIGPGPNTLNLPQAPMPGQGTGRMTALLQQLSATDATGILGQLMQAAQARGA